MAKKFRVYKQLDLRDCGPTCLRMICQYYGKTYSRETLREKTHITKQGVSLAGIAEAAENLGLRTLGLRVKPDVLFTKIPHPSIVPWRQRHFVVIIKSDSKYVTVADPAYGKLKYSHEEFLDGWNNSLELDANFVLAIEPSLAFFEKEDEQDKKSKSSLSLFWPYFRAHKRLLIQIIIGLCLGLVLQFVMPFLLQAVIDYGVNYQNINFIYLILIAQLVLYMSSTFIRIIRAWMVLHMSTRINIKMVSDFLFKILNLPLQYFETRNMGEHLQRIRDHQRIQDFLSASTLSTLFSFITLLVFSLILLYYNTTIFVIFLVGSVLFALWSLLFLKQRKLLDFKRFEKTAENDTTLVELIEGIKDVKVNNSKLRQRWKWERIQVSLYEISLKSLGLEQSQSIGAEVINELKNILITFVAAKSVVEGHITLGMMVSIQYIIGQLNGPLQKFISFLQEGQDAKISLDRLSEVHLKENEITNEQFIPILKDKSILLENISYRYGGKNSPMVLKDVSIRFPEGSVTAIVGASGSGKTTLVKMLLQFMHPTSGTIKIGNNNLKKINADYWREQCGVVLQNGYLFNDTIGQNIAESEQSGTIDRGKLAHAAYVANIDSHIERLPLGYSTKAGEGGHRLSGGQVQRMHIARAIYKNPHYIFLDEATSALDANNEKVIVDRLNEALENKTVIVVAHRLSTVKNADNIIVLEDGKVVEQGNHIQLTNLKGTYYNLVKNQLELGN